VNAPSLRTDRLVLLPLSAADVDEAAALYSDPEVMRHVSGGIRTRPETLKRLEACEHDWSASGIGIWAIRDATTGGLLGEGGVHPDSRVADGAMAFSITIGRRSWGSGVDLEAGRAIVDDAWDRHPCAAIQSTVLPEDVSGSGVLSRLDFVLTGVRDFGGEPHQIWALDRPA